VKASKDGCGEVTVQIVKGHEVRVKVQFGFNVDDKKSSFITE
jgi:hypothetical protein